MRRTDTQTQGQVHVLSCAFAAKNFSDRDTDDKIYSDLENALSQPGWQQEPMTICLTYPLDTKTITYTTGCDGVGIAVCKKKIGNF